MKYRYDINRGLQKLKTKTFIVMSGLGLILGGAGLSLATFGTAHATSPSLWQLNAPNAIVFNCGSSNYNHTLNTVSEDSSGVFTGTGTYDPDTSYTWNINGNVSSNNVTFTVLYTGSNPGYTFNGLGTIASDGSISGSVSGGGCQTFTMPTGSATLFSDKTFDAAKKNNLKESQCSPTKHSKEVVDVSYKLINDYDSAVGTTSAWANDTIHRELNIWNTGQNTYCAIVKDNGSFVTFDNSSPNATGHVGAGIFGEMDGGYRTLSFTGTFIGSSGGYATHGNLGTFDLQCTDAYTCPGLHPSFASYFSDVDANSVGLAWWGWEYNTCQNGNWVNSSDGNFGDITGTAPSRNAKCHDDNDKHHHDNDGNHDTNIHGPSE